jgi:hypothetical protein
MLSIVNEIHVNGDGRAPRLILSQLGASLENPLGSTAFVLELFSRMPFSHKMFVKNNFNLFNFDQQDPLEGHYPWLIL